jgi:hypothetical protein
MRTLRRISECHPPSSPLLKRTSNSRSSVVISSEPICVKYVLLSSLKSSAPPPGCFIFVGLGSKVGAASSLSIDRLPTGCVDSDSARDEDRSGLSVVWSIAAWSSFFTRRSFSPSLGHVHPKQPSWESDHRQC